MALKEKAGTGIALITGITGQDGAYLAEFLLHKKYQVHGLVRWDAGDAIGNLNRLGIEDRVMLHYGDMTDAGSLARIIKETNPDEIYNLAALSHVAVSFQTPASALDIIAGGTLNLLEVVRVLGLEKTIRIYQASSSEMFGASPPPQNEDTPFHPKSPYGAAKLAAYWLARTYRESYGMFVANGILFNHESPLRGEDFVTRKIATGVAAIAGGSDKPLMLGNLEARRDWGHARDYVAGMWMMMQQDVPDDFILATGESRSVREFVEKAFACAGMDVKWQGTGLEETGIDRITGRVLVRIDQALFRPSEVAHLCGDASKARAILGWSAATDLDVLVREMVEAEMSGAFQKHRHAA